MPGNLFVGGWVAVCVLQSCAVAAAEKRLVGERGGLGLEAVRGVSETSASSRPRMRRDKLVDVERMVRLRLAFLGLN